MPIFTPFRLGAIALSAGLSAAAFTTAPDGVKAESALEFIVKQQQRRSGQETYPRDPQYVERPEGEGGVFGGMFGFEFMEEAPRPRVAAPNLQRAVCKRQCDGAQLVIGFLPTKSRQKEAEAMCAAAGGGAPTELVLEKFVPGKGFEVSAPIQTASAAPLQEGRAALDTSTFEKRRPAAPAGGSCPKSVTGNFMIVPILHDSTLRHGDVIATRGGFKIFVGGGKPPFKQSDFVDLDQRKRVSADLKKLKVAFD